MYIFQIQYEGWITNWRQFFDFGCDKMIIVKDG